MITQSTVKSITCVINCPNPSSSKNLIIIILSTHWSLGNAYESGNLVIIDSGDGLNLFGTKPWHELRWHATNQMPYIGIQIELY